MIHHRRRDRDARRERKEAQSERVPLILCSVRLVLSLAVDWDDTRQKAHLGFGCHMHESTPLGQLQCLLHASRGHTCVLKLLRRELLGIAAVIELGSAARHQKQCLWSPCIGVKQSNVSNRSIVRPRWVHSQRGDVHGDEIWYGMCVFVQQRTDDTNAQPIKHANQGMYVKQTMTTTTTTMTTTTTTLLLYQYPPNWPIRRHPTLPSFRFMRYAYGILQTPKK